MEYSKIAAMLGKLYHDYPILDEVFRRRDEAVLQRLENPFSSKDLIRELVLEGQIEVHAARCAKMAWCSAIALLSVVVSGLMMHELLWGSLKEYEKAIFSVSVCVVLFTSLSAIAAICMLFEARANARLFEEKILQLRDLHRSTEDLIKRFDLDERSRISDIFAFVHEQASFIVQHEKEYDRNPDRLVMSPFHPKHENQMSWSEFLMESHLSVDLLRHLGLTSDTAEQFVENERANRRPSTLKPVA